MLRQPRAAAWLAAWLAAWDRAESMSCWSAHSPRRVLYVPLSCPLPRAPPPVRFRTRSQSSRRRAPGHCAARPPAERRCSGWPKYCVLRPALQIGSTGHPARETMRLASWPARARSEGRRQAARLRRRSASPAGRRAALTPARRGLFSSRPVRVGRRAGGAMTGRRGWAGSLRHRTRRPVSVGRAVRGHHRRRVPRHRRAAGLRRRRRCLPLRPNMAASRRLPRRLPRRRHQGAARRPAQALARASPRALPTTRRTSRRAPATACKCGRP